LIILEERFVGRIWDIGLVLIGEFFKDSHSPPLVARFGPTVPDPGPSDCARSILFLG
jgi:hypothetical protein